MSELLVLDNCSLSMPIKVANNIKLSEGSRIEKNKFGYAVKALQNISLSISSGDRIGLVGTNGAGKSSLLKMIAGIYEPDSGQRKALACPYTLFNPSLGMRKNLTGYENIHYMSRLLGYDPSAEFINDVEEFTELGDFLHLPISSYSAGMKLRLGFALSTAREPELLLMDEVVGVGDKVFQAKAKARVMSMMDRSGALVMASHSDSLIKSLCNKVIELKSGKIFSIKEI